MIKDLNGHQVSVWALAVYHETERFFSAGSDGVIKVCLTIVGFCNYLQGVQIQILIFLHHFQGMGLECQPT